MRLQEHPDLGRRHRAGAVEFELRAVGRLAHADDAGELLTVQLAAYVTEAQQYGDPYIVPLVETLDEVRAAITAGHVLVAREGTRLVGSVRGVVADATCHVARLVVAPDLRGRGIGSALLAAVEARDAGRVRRYTLFTGHRSEGNLRLYRAAGYTATHAVPVDGTLSLVHLEKEAPRPSSDPANGTFGR